MQLPDLGVGLVHLPGLGPLLERLYQRPEVIEIEPQAYWSHIAGQKQFAINLELIEAAVGTSRPLIHSVGYPVGGASDAPKVQIAALRETLDRLRPPWWSDHASIASTGIGRQRRNFGFLLPPLQTKAAVAVIADRIKRIQDLFGLPFAFETGVNYFERRDGELADGDFWGAIAEQADCGILLDLHNIWTNEQNKRVNARDTLVALPLDRVWEVHVAGGQAHQGYWLDAHSDLPPVPVMDLARELVPKLPNLHALIFEIVPDYLAANNIAPTAIHQCLEDLDVLWALRGDHSERSPTEPQPLPAAPIGRHEMLAWEAKLAEAIDGQGTTEASISSRGLGLYRELISVARRGMIVEALPLSLRLLFRELDEERVDALFALFWERTPPEAFVADEARTFADFLRGELTLPHLGKVLDFELAAHHAALTGQAVTIEFNCDPEALLRSIATGRALDVRAGEVHLEIRPPSPAI